MYLLQWGCEYLILPAIFILMVEDAKKKRIGKFMVIPLVALIIRLAYLLPWWYFRVFWFPYILQPSDFIIVGIFDQIWYLAVLFSLPLAVGFYTFTMTFSEGEMEEMGLY